MGDGVVSIVRGRQRKEVDERGLMRRKRWGEGFGAEVLVSMREGSRDIVDERDAFIVVRIWRALEEKLRRLES